MATTLVITAAQVDSLIADPSSVTGYSSTKNIDISGDISSTQASNLKGVASPKITATVAQTSVSNLKAITVLSGRTNEFTLTTSGTTASAADLVTIKSLTSKAPNFGSILEITASSAADIKSLYTGTNASLGNEKVKVNDADLSASDLKTINAATTGEVTLTSDVTKVTGLTADLEAAFALMGTGDNKVVGLAEMDVVVTDSTIQAAKLAVLDGKTTTAGKGMVTIAAGSTVEGTVAEVKAVYDATVAATPTMAGLSDKNIILTDTTLNPKSKFTVAEVNQVANYTSGVLTATVKESDLDTVKGIIESGHSLTIELDKQADGNAKLNAQELKGVVDKLGSAGKLTVAAAVTDIDGTYADVYAVADSSKVTIQGDEKFAISNNINVSQANLLDAKTSGVITATLTDNDVATLDGLTTNLDTDGVTVLAHKYTVNVTDSSADAAKLNALDSKTSVDVTVSSGTITGTLAEVKKLYAASGATKGFLGLGAESVTLSDAALVAADLKTVEAATSLDVSVSAATSISGAIADLETVYGKNGAGQGIVGLGNETVSVTDADVDAVKLATVAGKTSGVVGFASTAKEISGKLAEIKAILDEVEKTSPGIDASAATKIIHVTDAIGTADAVALDPRVTGVIKASLKTSGDDIKLEKLLATTGGVPSGHELAITVDSDATAGGTKVGAEDLLKLINKTTGTVTLGGTPNEIVGNSADVGAVYSASGTAGINGGDEAVTLTGTEFAASDIVAISNTVSGTAGSGTTGVLTAGTASVVSNVTGSSSDLKKVFEKYHNGETGDGSKENKGKVKFTVKNPTALVTGAVALATDITSIDGDTTGVVTVTASKLKGSEDEVKAVAAVNDVAKINGVAAIDVELVDATVAEVNDAKAYTTGTISGALKSNQNTVALLKGLPTGTALKATLAVTATINATTETSLSAADLITITGLTSGKITIGSQATNVYGSGSDVSKVFTDSAAGVKLGGLAGTETVSILGGGTSVTDLNAITNLTSGKVTAAVSDNTIAALEGISKSGNALTIVVKDSTVDVTKLDAIAAKTTETLTVETSTITGKLAEINTAIASTSYTGVKNNDVVVTDTITAAEQKTLDGANTGEITATISDNYLDKLADITDANSKTHKLSITVKGDDSTKPTERTVDAAKLVTLEGKLDAGTVLTVDASTLNGAIAKITTLVNKDATASTPEISGLSNIAVTVTGGKTTAGNTLAAINNVIEKAGVVTATLVDNATAAGTDAAKLDKLIDSTAGLKGTGNKINLEINSEATTGGAATTVAAKSLIDLNSRTTGEISFTSNVDTIIGLASDVAAVYADSDDGTGTNTQIKNPGNLAVTISDKIIAEDLTTTPPTQADPGIVQAADLVAIHKAGTGTITLEATLGGISGTYADALYIIATNKGDFSGEQNDTVIVTDSITAKQLDTLGTETNYTGHITATISDTEMTKLADLSADDDDVLTINVKDATVDAGKLKTLNGRNGKGVITVDSGTVTGDIADIVSVYTAGATAIAGLGNEVVTVADKITIAQANSLTGTYTTGLVTATIDASTKTELDALVSSSNAYSVELKTDTAYVASDLKAIDAKTSGTVDASVVTTISGAASDVKSLYESNVAGGITGLGNEAVTITDAGSIAASDINFINSNTSGSLTVNKVTAITGSVDEIKAAYAAFASGTVTGLGNEAITISDIAPSSTDVAAIKALTTGVVSVSISSTSVTASTLKTLDADSTEAINVAGITAISGSSDDLKSLYSSAGITGLGNEAVTLTDTSTTASTLKTLDAATSGTINAGTVTSLSGSAADITAAYTSAEITGLGNEAVTLSDTKLSASELNTLDAKTTGKIDVSSLKTLTGTGAEAKAAFDSAGITLTFDASSYLAGYTDLLAAFGTDLAAAKAHYFASGVAEGRSFDAFDETSYLASHADLLKAYGTNTDSALLHYINNGYSEGRAVDTFDENSYLASNTSLIGTVTDAASHYVTTGYASGLALDTFDEFSYLASNTSLIGTVTAEKATEHYVTTGYAAGNSADSFDEFGYIASHTDLISAFGVDGVAGTKHYITHGSTEGRTVTFDAGSYLAAHADLRAAYGTDQELAKQHYILHGSDEGRAIA